MINHRQCVTVTAVFLERSYPSFPKLIGTSQVLYKVPGGEEEKMTNPHENICGLPFDAKSISVAF